MGKLILIRHGETPANRDRFFACDDTPLTEAGRRQAREVSEKIRDRFNPVAIISSHLTRAQQTAEIVARELALPLEVIEGLQECDFGDLKGKDYHHYGKLITTDPAYDAARPWTWVAPNGESTEQTQRRVLALLEQLREKYVDDEVLVVCHGMVMVAVWAGLTGKWEGVDVPPNCAVVVIEHDGREFQGPVLIEECLVPQG